MKNEIFIHVDTTAECPKEVCPTCAANGVEHIPSGIQFVHCEHHSAGATCTVQRGRQLARPQHSLVGCGRDHLFDGELD